MPDQHITAAFRQFDTDNSGDIDSNELLPALKLLGLNTDGAGAAQVLRKYSAGSKGLKLTQFEQLVKDLEKYQGGASPIRRTSVAKDAIDPKVRDAFKAFDKDDSGDIDLTELQAALKFLGMAASEAQARAVLRRYDVNRKSDTLDIFEFDRLVKDLNKFSGGSSGGGGLSGGGVDQRIRDAFKAFDADRSGDIDASELKEALAYLGMETSASQAREVLARYDSDRNRTLDLAEFAKVVTDVQAHVSKSAARPTGGASGVAIEARVRQAFETFDTNRDGGIDARELREALAQLGMKGDHEQARQLIARYDTQLRDAKLDLHEFNALVQDILA